MVHENGHIDAAAFKGGYRHKIGRCMCAGFPVYYDPIRWLAADVVEDETERGPL